MERFRDAARTSITSAFALLLGAAPGGAVANPPGFRPGDFPPSLAVSTLAVRVGDKVTVGGPTSANFLPDEWMDVFVVPHRAWWEGDLLAANAVQRIRIKSDAKGGLPRADLWKPDRAGQFDIIVDYDGNGQFSYALDALSSFTVHAK